MFNYLHSLQMKIVAGTTAILLVVMSVALYTIFSAVDSTLQLSIGETAVSVASKTINSIDQRIQRRIEQINALASRNDIKEHIEDSNQEFTQLLEIDQLMAERDENWIGRTQTSRLQRDIVNHPISELLRETITFYEQEYGYTVFGELFVTNQYGAVIAMSNVTTDYQQSDEQWWSQARRNGIFVEDIGYDESADMYALDIALRIQDDNDEFIGVMKASLNVEELMSLLRSTQEKTDIAKYMLLLTPSDHVIFDGSQQVNRMYESAAYAEYSALAYPPYGLLQQQNDGGLTVAESESAHLPMTDYDYELISYAYSAGYRDYPGLGWLLTIHHDPDELLAPVRYTQRVLFMVSVLALVAAIGMSFLLAESISRPISRFNRMVQAIAKGKFAKRLPEGRKDEIGQLGRAINIMAAALEKHETKLLEKQDNLSNALIEKEGARRALETEKEKISAVLHGMGEGLIAVDDEGKVILCNAGAEKILGKKEAELAGTEWTIAIGLTQEEESNKRSTPLEKAMSRGRTVSEPVGYLCTDKDGSTIPIAISASPVFEGKRAIGGVVVFRDTSQERILEQMKDNFVSLASHQLYTPLSALRWQISAIQDGYFGDIPEEQQPLYEEMLSIVKSMVRLIQGMLRMTRLEEGRVKAELTGVHLQTLTQEVLSLLEPTIDEYKHDVVWEAPKEDIIAHADQDMLHEVLMNLVDNAIHYTPAGGKISIIISKKDNHAIWEISDTGCGMTAEEQKHLFEKCYRAEGGRNMRPNGTGIGLYLTKMSLELMHGTVSVDSKKDEGTTFTLRLPISDS